MGVWVVLYFFLEVEELGRYVLEPVVLGSVEGFVCENQGAVTAAG